MAAVRPVDRRIAGSRGKGKGEPYWQKMYAELGVERAARSSRTTVGQMEIRAYWNSGLVAARRSAGLFTAWEQRARTGSTTPELVPKRWPQFMDQLSWAAVTADVHDRVRVLSDAYNYPLRHRASRSPPAAVELDLAEIVHLHYRLWFHMPDALAKVDPAVRPRQRPLPLARRAAAARSPRSTRRSVSSSRARLLSLPRGDSAPADLGVARVEPVCLPRAPRATPPARRPPRSAIRAASSCRR